MYLGQKGGKTLEKSLSLFQERDHFSPRTAETEIIASFVEGITETSGCSHSSQTTHRIMSLFDITMILLSPIIQVLTRPMLHRIAHGLADSSWRGCMAIGSHLIRNMTNDSRPIETPLSCLPIPFLTQHRIHEIAIVVDSPIQIAPFSVNPDIRFLSVPPFSGLTSAFERGNSSISVSLSCFYLEKDNSHLTECQGWSLSSDRTDQSALVVLTWFGGTKTFPPNQASNASSDCNDARDGSCEAAIASRVTD